MLAAEIRPADHADSQTMVDSVVQAQVNLEQAGREQQIEEVAADKAYHAAANLELCESLSLRTYIPEPKRKHAARWTDKPAAYQRAVYANRRRLRRAKSKRWQRRRSELCERTFAHICDSGGMRRTWIGGLVDVAKRYLIAAAAHNLGRVLWKLFGVGKPKALQGEGSLAALVQLLIASSRQLHGQRLGLHDMHGNVWEWCRDCYKDTLLGGTDPEVTEKEKGVIPLALAKTSNRVPSNRVLRGGSWLNQGRFCRSAHRYAYWPGGRNVNIGFRVAAVQSGK